MTAADVSEAYRVLVQGVFDRPDVRMKWQEVGPDVPRSHQEAVDSFWEGFSRSRPAARVYDGELCRLLEYRAVGNRLTLTLGRGRYRDLLYSNAHARELVAEERRDLLSRTLGVSVVVRTAEGRVVLLHRSRAVGEAPGMLDVVGGHIEPPDSDDGPVPDPFAAIGDEVLEELHVPPGRLRNWRCLGLIETTDTLKPELIFTVEFTGGVSELNERSGRARDRFEFQRLLFVPEERLPPFVQRWWRRFSPSALGAVHLYLGMGGSKRPSRSGSI